MPAVASDGGPEAADEHAFARSGDDRVGAFQQADAAEALDSPRGRLQAMGVHPRRLHVEQAGQLAGVRRQDGGRLPLERLQLEQRVGVDDGGQLRLHEQPPNELPAGVVASQAGADRKRACLLHGVEDFVQRPFHGLQQAGLEHRQRLGRRRHCHIARVGAERGLGSEARRPRETGRPAHDEHGRLVLRVARLLPGNLRQDLPGNEQVRGLSRLEPDVADDELAALEAPRADDVAHFRPVQRDGHGRLHGAAADLTGVRIHAGGQVDRKHRSLGGVQLRDHLGRLRPRLAVEAGAEEAVQEHFAFEAFRGLVTHRAQHLQCDPRIATVGAAAADGTERPRVREPADSLLRNRPSGALHQHAHVVARLGRAHLIGRVQRLEHQSDEAIAMAAASSLECVIDRSTPATPRRAARSSSRPVSCTDGLGRPTISTSRHANALATPKPSAFPTASLPANLAA